MKMRQRARMLKRGREQRLAARERAFYKRALKMFMRVGDTANIAALRRTLRGLPVHYKLQD